MTDQKLHVRSFVPDPEDFEFRADGAGDGLTLRGYIAKFREPTMIHDHLGEYEEELERGAFSESLTLRGPAKVKMQFDHGHDALFGGAPIGVWEDLREDRKGLFGVGRVADDWATIPLRVRMEMGAIDGMSFRFKVIEERWRKPSGAGGLDHRTLLKVALFEAGPVVYPAYEGTSVALRHQALDLWRRALNPTPDVAAATLDVEAVAPVGDTEPPRSEAVTPVGDTRRELRRMALDALRSVTNATGVAS